MAFKNARQFLSVLGFGLGAFRSRLTFSMSTEIAVLHQGGKVVDEVGRGCAELGAVLQETKNADALQKLFSNCKTVAELNDALTAHAAQVVRGVQLNICLDAILIAVNLWSLCSTYALLNAAKGLDDNVTRWMAKRNSKWELGCDQIQRFTTLSPEQRANARARLMLELYEVQQRLHDLDNQVRDLRSDFNFKCGLILVNGVALFTGGWTYAAAWKTLPWLTQVTTVGTCLTLSAATALHISQILDIQTTLKNLDSSVTLLRAKRDQMEQAVKFPSDGEDILDDDQDSRVDDVDDEEDVGEKEKGADQTRDGCQQTHCPTCGCASRLE